MVLEKDYQIRSFKQDTDIYIFFFYPEAHSLQKRCVSLAALCLSNTLIANASDPITFT